MKRLLTIVITLAVLSSSVMAQDKNEKKHRIVRFNNITEFAVGFQMGKTTRITSYNGGELETEVAGRKIPSPRISSSFGILLADVLFVGPGLGYTFQAEDSNNAQEHQVSVFGHARLNFARGRFRPFADFRGGYHFASFEELDNTLNPDWYKWDGFFLEPALGIAIKLGGHALVNTSLGYQFINAGNRIEQTIVDENSNALVNAAMNEKYHRFLLSVGFTFQ
ncbi:MAG: hypothetical protein H6601_05920 [Flavobacteriales bacterium]|nr:hypothetical protein [Flavobacteriales bacterium]